MVPSALELTGVVLAFGRSPAVTANPFLRAMQVRPRAEPAVAYRMLLRYRPPPVRPQRPVMTLSLYELFMRPDLSNASVDEDDNSRVAWNRVVAMCGEQDDL